MDIGTEPTAQAAHRDDAGARQCRVDHAVETVALRWRDASRHRTHSTVRRHEWTTVPWCRRSPRRWRAGAILEEPRWHDVIPARVHTELIDALDAVQHRNVPAMEVIAGEGDNVVLFEHGFLYDRT